MINMSPLAITIYKALKLSGAKKGIPFEITAEDLAKKVDIHVEDTALITAALNDLFRAQITNKTSEGDIVHSCIDHIEVMHGGAYLLITLGT